MFDFDDFKSSTISKIESFGLYVFHDKGDWIKVGIGDTRDDYFETPAIDLRLIYTQNESRCCNGLSCEDLSENVANTIKKALNAQTKK